MQDNTLGVQSLIDNGGRNSLIPLMISYCTNRIMTVKWKDEKSSKRDLPGGSAQGTILGPITYLNQNTKSADCVPETDKFKYIDDLSVLGIVTLMH